MRFAMSETRLVFLKYYKYMAIYNMGDNSISTVFNLTTAYKLWIDTSTNELVVGSGSTSLYKTTYTMNSDAYVDLTDTQLIICTGDPGDQICIDSFILTDQSNCPNNVSLQWNSNNSLSVYSTCGNEACSTSKAGCKEHSTCTTYTSI